MKIIVQEGSKKHQNGAALIMVFWLIAILTLTIFTAVKVVRNDVSIMVSQKKAFRATQLAEMGIAIASNPATSETDLALLRQTISDGESFEVRLRGEGGSFNINNIIQRQDKGLLKTIFTYWGMEEEDSDALVDALMDWTDENDFTELHGAEQKDYEELGFSGYPFNRPFYSIDEMRFVRGMDLAILLQPRWRDYFTIYSAGALDINEAPAELIALATSNDAGEVPTRLEEAEELVELRLGEDLIEDTEDDRRLSIAEALASMGLTPGNPLVDQRLTQQDNTVRIESTGKMVDFSRKIIVVLRDRNQNPQILTREEVALF